jgi:tetratricopeptide (TPR) repeat protein
VLSGISDAMASTAPNDWLSRAGRYPPRLIDAALALHDNRLGEAEPLLKAHLRDDPFDVTAIRMLAELAGRIGRYQDAEALLRRAIELAPGFTAARGNLALVLYRLNRPDEALAQLDTVLAEEPDNLGPHNLRAAALGRIGGFDEALGIYEDVLKRAPAQPKVWMSYAHTLKTVGRLDEGVAAYRRALTLNPRLGEVWWSLANLKTVRFDDADIAAMQDALASDGLSDEDRFHLDFALGKAFEDRKQAPEAFVHYEAGNALRRKSIIYDADRTERSVDASIATFSTAFFAEREDWGFDAPDPIFVVGMPRAGSTLIEQILSSHPLVEGTSELADIPRLARRHQGYPKSVADLSADECRALGEEYLKATRIQRRSDRPFFIDKLPNNWAYAPFIRLILPGAKIIDARRHPLSCGFSNFKQHFAKGQGFSYDLTDFGRYYRDYVRLMAHVDRALPGAVHRVIYERMVEETETEVRALLAYCGLEFDPACLAFYENDRAVRTPSSEQVRRPIFREGTEAWKPFEPWLDPLKSALREVLLAYPTVPGAL